MNKTQFLLLKLSEECNEVGQRASKQIQFGKTEVQKGQSLTNGERLKNEIMDLYAIVELLQREWEMPTWTQNEMNSAVEAKRQKLQKYLELSHSLNQLPKIIL